MNAATLASIARTRLARAVARAKSGRQCRRCKRRPVTKYRKLDVCHTCYQRSRRRSNPARCLDYVGSCTNGCGRRGRGRSGFCKVCYGRGWHRRWRRQAMLKRIMGTALTLDQITAGLGRCSSPDPQAGEAVKAARMLLWEMRQGNVYFSRREPRRAKLAGAGG